MWNDLPLHVTSAQSRFSVSQDFPVFSLLPTHSYVTYLLFFLLFSGIPCGPEDNWHYLSHVKHVGDDDSGYLLQLLATGKDARRKFRICSFQKQFVYHFFTYFIEITQQVWMRWLARVRWRMPVSNVLASVTCRVKDLPSCQVISVKPSGRNDDVNGPMPLAILLGVCLHTKLCNQRVD